MTKGQWIVDPDPATLRIGMECEAMPGWHTIYQPATVLGKVTDDRDCPWIVRLGGYESLWSWAAHIRIKKPELSRWKPSDIRLSKPVDEPTALGPSPLAEVLSVPVEPTALVPMTREDVELLHSMGVYHIAAVDYKKLNDLAKRIEAHLPKPKPPRPEIAVDEAVWVRDHAGEVWIPANFAGWSKKGKPMVWEGQKTKHTAHYRVALCYIKTKSGQVWPTEGDEN